MRLLFFSRLTSLSFRGEQADSAMANGVENRSIPVALPQRSNAKKRKCEADEEEPARPQHQQKKPKRKTGPKKAFSRRKAAPSKSEVAGGQSTSAGSEAGAAKINPHRARILVGKKALAAIKGGTSELANIGLFGRERLTNSCFRRLGLSPDN